MSKEVEIEDSHMDDLTKDQEESITDEELTISKEEVVKIIEIIVETISNYAEKKISINQIVEACNEIRGVEHTLDEIILDFLDFLEVTSMYEDDFETAVEISALEFFENLAASS